MVSSVPTQGGKRSLTMKAIGICLLSLVLLDVYAALDTSGSFRFSEVPGFMNYNMLGQAFLAGQLHLQQAVPPERAAAADPSNPRLPYPYQFDAIIFHGKYYFQHLPFPALAHAAWIMLTGNPLHTGLVVVLAAFGCVIWLGMMMQRLRRVFFPDSPPWLLWLVLLSFALSGVQLYLVSRPVIYHEAIVAGMFFALGGMALCLASWTSAGPRPGMLALAGVLFGAAIVSRATLVFYPACFGIATLAHSVLRKRSIAETVKECICLGAPIALFGMMLLLYNYERFGGFFDAGLRHVALPWPDFYEYCCVQGNYFRLGHVPYQLYHWLLGFGGIGFRGWIPVVPLGVEAVRIGDLLVLREQLSSIFLMVPMLVFLLPVPFLLGRARGKTPLLLMLAACASTSLLVFGVLMAYCFACARFMYDFAPPLFILIFFSVAALWEVARNNAGARLALILVLALVLLANCLAGVVMGFTGMLQTV